MMDDPPHHPVVFHLAKLLDQHFLGNSGNRPPQLREPQDLLTEQMEKDQELPAALEDLERLLHVPARRRGAYTSYFLISTLLFCAFLPFSNYTDIMNHRQRQ